MIPDTQRASWRTIQDLSEKRAKVLSVISQTNGIALWEIAEKLGWPINCVSGRVTELQDLGLVRDSGKRGTNPHSGKKAILWLGVSPTPQGELFALEQPALFKGH